MAIEQNIGKRITREEAYALTDENQKSGFVMQCANDQRPNFFCACCSDCCGLLKMFKAVPNPAEYVASNFSAAVNNDVCVGCTLCVKKCPMDAIVITNKMAVILYDRCIGCGVCTIACSVNAIELIKRSVESIPPMTVEDLFVELNKSKINLRKKLILVYRFIKRQAKLKITKLIQ